MSRPHGIAFLAANPISPPHGWHPSRSSCVTCHRLNNAGRSPRTTWLPLDSFLPKILGEALIEEALFHHQTEPKKLVQRSYHSLPNEQRITYRESILCPSSVLPPRALFSHARGAFGECGNPAFVLLDVPLRAYLPADPNRVAHE